MLSHGGSVNSLVLNQDTFNNKTKTEEVFESVALTECIGDSRLDAGHSHVTDAVLVFRLH